MSYIKVKVYTQIIFKQETNLIWTLTIHKQTSLNFDDKKYIILDRCMVSVSQYCTKITHVKTWKNHHFTAYLYIH